MKKLNAIVMTALLTVPVIALAAENDATDHNQSLVAASYQQGEDSADPAAPVTQVVPVSAVVPASGATDTAAVTKPAETAPAASILSKTVDSLSQQVSNLQANINQIQQQDDMTRQQIAEIQYTVYGLAALVVLLALLSLVRRRKRPARPVQAAPVVVAAAAAAEVEYDFMGSSEGIPAKLDLARAYIAMEDVGSARDTLIEILTEGNEEQRLEAKSLLSKIKR